MKWWFGLLCGLAFNVQAETFDAKVIAVLDGDTVLVLRGTHKLKVRPRDGGAEPSGAGEAASHLLPQSAGSASKVLKVRLADIDAPEKAQPYGKQSRRSLCELACKREVQIEQRAVDQYKRIIGTLYVAGLNVNQEQVRRGMAWEYSYYHRDRTYLDLQSEARTAQRGLWQQNAPEPPWQWRKEHPRHVPGEASRLREGVPDGRSRTSGLRPTVSRP
ncbi:MAG: thermonuclease family protein, partial [Sideroxyarcus sp.]|nr:thermonuclease family protein [Sideroxyarcus sp.]